jgi:hypothetical protein
MSVATFNEFLKTIDLSSPGFVELASNVTSPSDLSAYAQKNGVELSTEEATEVIDTAKRQLKTVEFGPLTEEQLENVTGGSFLGVLAGVGAVAGLVGAAIIFAPVVLSTVVGTTAAFALGTTGVMTAAGAGLGAMIGGAIDLITSD